jgi:outer membrane protein assembly factor BamB
MARVSPPPRGERSLPRLAIGIVVLAIGAAIVLALLLHGNDNSFNPHVGFVATDEDGPSAAASRARSTGHPADDGFVWPVYGFSQARTHDLPLTHTPRPPYVQAWALRGRVLLEFSPVLCGRRLYLLKNNGAIYAVSRTTGRVSWKRRLGALAAASPACAHGTIYVVLLQRNHDSGGGRVVALSAKHGRTRWSRKLPSRSESSPLIDSNRLFLGSEDGTVYSLRASDGATRWKIKVGGAVKGAIALADDKLYFGDYAGHVHAVKRSTGQKIWDSSPGAGPLGLGAGNFYSSAAVEYGRVYIGSTNGVVYSLSSADGKLAWSHGTGGYVYASPAVGAARHVRPSVYIGSYDGRFYALDARTGKPRWVRSLGTKISGSASIIGDLVFVSDLGKTETWALSTRTGRTVWKTGRGAFNPVISDGRRIYFTAYTSLFALDPKGHPFVRSRTYRERLRATARRVARRQAQRRARARAKRAQG